MNTKDKIGFSGFVYYLIFSVIFNFMARSLYEITNDVAPIGAYILATMLAIFIWLLVFLINLYEYVYHHKRRFPILNIFAYTPDDISRDKHKAMYPPVANELLKTYPKGIVFGKHNRKYVCRDIEQDGHVFVIGGSGSGKSSCLVIPTLLVNPDITTFAFDIKGELHKKSVKKINKNVRIFDPSDRFSYGYNPFYKLNEESSNQDILETMQLIAYSLISLPADVKEPFWKLSARNLLIGLMMYYYKLGADNFIDIMDLILGKPVKEQIKEAVGNCEPSDLEYRYLIEFYDLAEITMSGIFMELSTHITIFATDSNIRYALRENFIKTSPMDLEKQKSIYISIREEKLTAYYDVLQLIINQMLSQLEQRAENSHRILFVIDELPRILSAGKIERLLDGARTLRSRNVVLFLVTQSVEALTSAFTENEVVDLISNCPYIIVLSATSTKTQQMVQEWCGVFKEKQHAWSGGIFARNEQISYEEKNVVTATDLMQLQLSGDAILISPYGYSRIKKSPYYSDNNLKVLSDEIRNYNESI